MSEVTLFSNIWKYFGWGGLTNPETGAQHSGPRSTANESDVPLSDSRAMSIAIVWACVKLITETTSGLPLDLFQLDSKGNKQPLDRKHQLRVLFKRSPNNFMTPLEFREAMTLQFALWGNGYAHIRWNKKKTVPLSIIPLRPELVTPIRTERGMEYQYQTQNGIMLFPKRDVFHLKGMSADGIVGLSPLEYGRHTLGVTVAGDRYAANSFANRGMPAGTINFEKFLKPEQREQARKLYEGISAQDLSRLWVMEGGATYTPIQIKPDDMQMLESRQFQLGEIARMFLVPSHKLNDSSKATSWGSGIEQLNIGFLQNCIGPYLKHWETTITDALLVGNDKEDVVAKHNVEGLLRADSASRASFLSTMVQNGLMTRNEARKKENLPASTEEGADDLTVQINLSPIQDLSTIVAGDPNANQET